MVAREPVAQFKAEPILPVAQPGPQGPGLSPPIRERHVTKNQGGEHVTGSREIWEASLKISGDSGDKERKKDLIGYNIYNNNNNLHSFFPLNQLSPLLQLSPR